MTSIDDQFEHDELFVQTTQLTKRYGNFLALNQVTTNLERGKVVGLLGPNGSGKSTLIRLFLGFIKPTAGSARIAGLDCYQQRVAAHRLLSYLPGDARLDRALKAKSIIKFYANVRSDGDYDRAIALAEQLELDLNARVAFMSTGMRQKLALAICLSVDAPLIILDEPTANLDPTVRQQVLQLILEAKTQYRSVIVSSHILSEIEQTCDEVIFLRKGEMMLQSSVAKLKGGHRVLATCQDQVEISDSISKSVKVISQHDARIEIELEQVNATTLNWLSEQRFSDIRIESAGLQTTYDQFHGLTEIGNE